MFGMCLNIKYLFLMQYIFRKSLLKSRFFYQYSKGPWLGFDHRLFSALHQHALCFISAKAIEMTAWMV